MRWGVWALVGMASSLTFFELGCGKTTIATLRISTDGGTSDDSSTRDATSIGVPEARASDDGAPDGGVWPHLVTDAAPRPLVDATTSPLDCASVRSLAGRILTPRRPQKVLFSPDGRYIVMVVRALYQPPGVGTMDDLVLITLPDGTATTLSDRVYDVSWLGQTNMLLVERTDDLRVVDLAGNALAVAPRVCDSMGTPDGRYVYALRDCWSNWPDSGLSQLDVVDIQTMSTTSYGGILAGGLGAPALREGLSPSGRWFAYVAATFPEAGAAPVGIIHLRDRTGNDYPIGAPHPGSTDPRFVSEDSLLFVTSGPADGPTNIYRYALGSTSSLPVATDRHVGFSGYKVSPDGKRLLGARWLDPASNELYAIHLDDSGETLLASDLLRYQLNTLYPSAFAFTRDGNRVVYLNDHFSGTSSAPVDGGAPTKISNATRFLVSPYADRVATLEATPTRDHATLYVNDPANSAPSFTYDSTLAIYAITFVPGDRGLLFIESTTTGASRRLRHLSFSDGALTDLDPRSSGGLGLSAALGEMQQGYPVDPTGCYVVIDSDVPGAEGTRIALVPN